MKRITDFILAVAGLLLLSPLLLLSAVLVRLDGPGPVLFRQIRVGRHGRPFTILKFRTMGEGGAGECRVTRWGAVLRRSKLDELPQLINVLAGQMSLVGPRPEVPPYVALWSAADRALLLTVRPGLTDFASIMFRHEERLLAAQSDPETYYRRSLLPRKLRLYRFYVRKSSTGLDLWLIVQTLRALLGFSCRPSLKGVLP
jgi:lipopolysaccharide/colanic/teichoic acid biosynthesis glycosyltransferase